MEKLFEVHVVHVTPVAAVGTLLYVLFFTDVHFHDFCISKIAETWHSSVEMSLSESFTDMPSSVVHLTIFAFVSSAKFQSALLSHTW